MTDAEPAVETQELSKKVLGLLGGYRMGAALDARDLYTKTLAGVQDTPPPPQHKP